MNTGIDTGTDTGNTSTSLPKTTTTTTTSADDDLLRDFYTKEELARALKVTPRTIERWKARGEGPPLTRLGKRPLYAKEQVREWLREQAAGRGRRKPPRVVVRGRGRR